MTDDSPTEIILYLTPLSGEIYDPIRLRRLLKHLRRTWGLRCTGIEWVYDQRSEAAKEEDGDGI